MDTPWKKEHLGYASQRFSVADVVRQQMTDAEVCYLQRWGTWLEALADGVLSPETNAQAAFVESARDLAPARTFAEHVWRRYVVSVRILGFRTPDLWKENRRKEQELSDWSEEALAKGLDRPDERQLLDDCGLDDDSPRDGLSEDPHGNTLWAALRDIEDECPEYGSIWKMIVEGRVPEELLDDPSEGSPFDIDELLDESGDYDHHFDRDQDERDDH